MNIESVGNLTLTMTARSEPFYETACRDLYVCSFGLHKHFKFPVEATRLYLQVSSDPHPEAVCCTRTGASNVWRVDDSIHQLTPEFSRWLLAFGDTVYVRLWYRG